MYLNSILPLVEWIASMIMDICNIKIHCRIRQNDLNLFVQSFKNKGAKIFPSFEIFKIQNFSYICYYSGFLNVTGLKQISDIENSLNILKNYFKVCNLKFGAIVIDNITTKCTCVKQEQICLQNKKEKILASSLFQDIITIKYEREIFPNMFLKTKHMTIIWSSNNKVSCVGLKNIAQFQDACELIKQLSSV